MRTQKNIIFNEKATPPVKYPHKTALKIALIVLCGMISTLVSVSHIREDHCSNWASAVGAIASYMGFHWPNCGAGPTLSGGTVSETVFDWRKITPSANLNWVECYQGNQCARLEVPLDYSDPKGDKAAVALLRVKAKVHPDSKDYRGPVLFNPGGPGGSGLSLIKRLGESYQQLLGDEYDIVGFDPRGIGKTTPAISVFRDDVERAYWFLGTPPLLNSTPDALPRSFSRAQLFSQLVESRSKQAAQHVSTATVARDMLSIVKAHGRERLQYWGFSYGTVLGATFAAMFPNNIERLIIDGVVDYDDYYSGAWSKNLLDTDRILQFVYDKCAETAACPLHANSSALVQQRVESLFASIKNKPMAAISGGDYSLIDYTLIKLGLFQSLYSPFTMVQPVLQALAALERGDGREVLEMIPKLPKCDTSPLLTGSREAGVSITCSDAKGVENTLSEITEHFRNLRKISVFADIWTDLTRVVCADWKVPAKERFSGPFSTNTSFPLLVIGNTADPVTPLVGARKAARTFADSVLLTIDTPGHCSLAATSLCTAKAIRNYFQKGNLPVEGTICGIEDVLFGTQNVTSLNMNAEDSWLFRVSRSLSRDFHASRGSLPL